MPNNLYRLNSISLNNFWCYNNEPNMFEMGESVTVIIGLNGAGKTAFLSAGMSDKGTGGDGSVSRGGIFMCY